MLFKDAFGTNVENGLERGMSKGIEEATCKQVQMKDVDDLCSSSSPGRKPLRIIEG